MAVVRHTKPVRDWISVWCSDADAVSSGVIYFELDELLPAPPTLRHDSELPTVTVDDRPAEAVCNEAAVHVARGMPSADIQKQLSAAIMPFSEVSCDVLDIVDQRVVSGKRLPEVAMLSPLPYALARFFTVHPGDLGVGTRGRLVERCAAQLVRCQPSRATLSFALHLPGHWVALFVTPERHR